VATYVVLLVLAEFVCLGHPLAMEEFVPTLQSEAFAGGQLVGTFPPALMDWLVKPAIWGHFIKVNSGTRQVASSYCLGFAALLTPFTLLGLT
jgi:hypothetical protein